ncbi:MAG: hypothetical protein U9P42_10950 [Candidatus Fermentibacteria bacterium]|nr:hypothetical protein [Candidatus Fermentibacteria bacterium]
MNYSYLILVVVGLFLSIFGFIRNGQSQGNSLGAALLFLLGIILLTFGILLTSVPEFFAG